MSIPHIVVIMANLSIHLVKSLENLSDKQLQIIEGIVRQFDFPFIVINRNEDSDLITQEVLQDFGDVLRIHHSFSREPFTKDKFEYALEKILSENGVPSLLSSKGNRGHDIIIAGKRYSLKTQADTSIKEDRIHISKFMELGKGIWTDDPIQLEGLRDSFIHHMDGYDRLLTLRCLKRGPEVWTYELVEIPLSLLFTAKDASLRMNQNSRQMPKPGYADVFDENGGLKFQLYFDGGSERKLQIKNLLKNNCIVHGLWSFKRFELGV